MGMITLRIDDVTEQRFRELAKKIYGEDNGYLDQAAAEAISLWILDKEQDMISRMALALLEKRRDLGKCGFCSRTNIHDRKPFPD